ncbi:nonsense-mediated mRNA decay factor SMG5-like [Macrotis lagotis]|uniref:nonsense-mediated mRNA decay factor SMG5-like n=1 Tax=Macrotis lagotis TaxID=92651 RepID=UPI003D69A0A9
MSNIVQDASLYKEDLVARQIYQKALELGKQLNIILSKDNASQEIFQPQSLTLRSQVQQLCIKLMFLDPVQYGEKAEEFLWMNVYYNVILLGLKDRMHHIKGGEVDFERHSDEGVAFYQNLFSFLQEHYQLEFGNSRTHGNIIDCRRVIPASEKEIAWAQMACYHCLLYLGDLFLFQSHIRSSYLKNIAMKYYFKALSVAPQMGMPYNRLANLVGDNNYDVRAPFFYQCSIHSEVPARIASFHLRSLNAKAVEMYNQLKKCQMRMVSSGQKMVKPNQRLLVSFLYLQNFLQPESCTDPQLALLSQSVLEDFRLCLSRKNKGEHKNDFFLPDLVIFHMVTLCIMSVYSLKKAVGVHQSRAAITFILMLFSHLVHHMNVRIQSELDGVDGSKIQETNDIQRTDSDIPAPNNDLSYTKALNIPQHFHSTEPCYHFIFGNYNDQSQDCDSNTDYDSHNPLEKNDSYEEAIFSFDLDSNSKKWSHSMENKEFNCPPILEKQLELREQSKPQSTNQPILGTHKIQTQQGILKKAFPKFRAVTGKRCPESDTFSNARKRKLSGKVHLGHVLRKKLCIFATQELLYTIKIFLNWFWIDPDLTLECTQSSPRLWSHLSVLLNLLPSIKELEGAHLDLSSHLWDVVMITKESHLSISLLFPEDSGTCNILPMKEAHKWICFIRVPPFISPIEKGILYTCFLRSFGHFAAQQPHSLLRFYPSQGIFKTISSVQELKSQKRNVIREWLHPGGSIGHAQRQLPLYLVPDTQAFCQYLPVIQELILDGSFIMIISSDVIDELIVLKYKEPGALATINFLKDKLKEKSYMHSNIQTNPGKKDIKSRMSRENPDTRDLYQILEDCKGLVEAPKLEVDDRSQKMNVLTGLIVDNPRTFSHPLLSDFKNSNSISVDIKHVLQFYREWKMIR